MIFNILNFIEILFVGVPELTTPGIIKTLIDGIAFISSKENVLMGEIFNNYYCIAENTNNNIIPRTDININKGNRFKVLIDNYILEDYLIFNNAQNNGDNNLLIYNQNTNKILIQKMFLFGESFLIGNQKIFFDYKEYLCNLINGGFNFKILINKSIINSNILEDIYYNISLELLLDIQNESSKSFLYFGEEEHIKGEKGNNINKNKNYIKSPKLTYLGNKRAAIISKDPTNKLSELLYNNYKQKGINDLDLSTLYLKKNRTISGINSILNFLKGEPVNPYKMKLDLFKKYFKILKENPYKIKLDLMYLYKKYPKSVLLTYGLDYDINILQSKKYILSTGNKNILNTEGKLNINNIINIKLYNINMINGQPKKNNNQIIADSFLIEEKIRLSRKYAKGLPSYLGDGIKRIYHPTYVGLTYDNIILDFFKKKYTNYQSAPVRRMFYSALNKNFFRQNYLLLGGYSYLGAGHQDAVIYHGNKGAGGAPLGDDYIKGTKMKTYIRLPSLHTKKGKKVNITLPGSEAEFIYNLKHGANIYNIYEEYHPLKGGGIDVEKQRFLNYIIHGRRALEVQKKFLHTYLVADDLGIKYKEGKGNKQDKLFKKLIQNSSTKKELENYVNNATFKYFKVYMNIIVSETFKDKLIGQMHKFLGDDAYKTKNSYIFCMEKPYEKYKYKNMVSILSKDTQYDFTKGGINRLRRHFLGQGMVTKFRAARGLTGPGRKEYFIDYGSRKTNILTRRYLYNNNNITGDTFYTTIENTSDSSLTLNYINKNFYGKYLKKDAEIFLVSKFEFKTNLNLPKNTNILIKKAYIENLIYVYHKEEEPMINYIQYKRIKSGANILEFFDKIYNILKISFLGLVEGYQIALEVIFKKISRYIGEMRHIHSIVVNITKGYNLGKEYYKYLGIILIILIYIIISSLIILLIKSFLPKNLIYGIKIKDKIKLLKEIGNMLEPINNKKILKKDFFDIEHKFVYRGDNRLDKLNFENSRENRTNINKTFNGQKQIVYNKYEMKKKKDVNNNYVIFYKTFLFDKNLEKGENNTKFRATFLLGGTFLKRYKKRKLNLGTGNYKSSFLNFNIGKFGITKMGKGFTLLYRDKKGNYNRKLIGKDPTVDEDSKIIYYHLVPKLFFNLFFVIKFTKRVFELGELRFGIERGTQLVKYGVHSRLSYRDIKKELQKEGSLEGYKDNLDFGPAILYRDYSRILERFNTILTKVEDPKVEENQKERNNLIKKIIKLTIEKNKIKKIKKFQELLKNLKNERYILNNYDSKFDNIKTKLLLDTNTINTRELIKQDLMLKYINEVQKLKETLEQQEFKLLKQNYTVRINRDSNDDKKSLEVLDEENGKKIQLLYHQKIKLISYEKKLRIENHKNNIIDKILDNKEQTFYESIKEYNKELSDLNLEIEKKEKLEKLKGSEYESISKKLYFDLEKHYIGYRFFTTMGARLNYILSLIITIFTIGTEHIQKIRKNDNSFQGIILLICGDLSKYIYKIYGEYIIIGKRYKTFTKLGYNVFDILKFSLILTPLVLYASSLYIILFLYVILKIDLKINKNNKIQKLKFIINIIFINLNKEFSILDKLYIKFYKFCGGVQYNIFFIKGAFILGYKENGLKEGINKIYILFVLKYRAYKEKKKVKIKIKININKNIKGKKKKDIITLKWSLLNSILNIETKYLNGHDKFVKFLYENFILGYFKIDRKEFYIIYHKNVNLVKVYFKLLIGYLSDLINLITILKGNEILILFLKGFGNILCLPITFIINHQKGKYIKNYKKGVFGFINNPMYLIIDNPKKKNNGKLKLHKILMSKKISKILYLQRTQENFIIEIFLLFKMKEVKLKNKNIYQEYFGKGLYGKYKEGKDGYYNGIIPLVQHIETSYSAFEESLATRNLSLGKKYKYTYNLYKLNKHKNNLKNRLNEKKMSRDIFFYKKAQDRKKIIRIYFFKGIINGLTYITINKIFFKNTKKLKKQKLKVNKVLKYKLSNIDEKAHLGYIFDSVPPQFGTLFIMYESYYKNILRYQYENISRYPIQGEEGLEKSSFYKWRLSPTIYVTRVPFYDRGRIAIYLQLFNSKEMLSNLGSKPYDPLVRGGIFLLEYCFSDEELNDKGINVGGDISMSHLLTYNSSLDHYQYEVRDFNRLIKGTSAFRIAENSLERDKAIHYKENYELIRNNILLKNKNVFTTVLNKRRKKAAKLLEKALNRYKLITPLEQDAILREERLKDYFYHKKTEFFDMMGMSEYIEGQSEGDSKEPEDKYFSNHEISKVKRDYDMGNYEGKKSGKPKDLDYLMGTLALHSLDQTLEEINYFLKFDIGKIIEKKEKNKIRNINYKHVNIKPSLLNRINSHEHVYYYNKKLIDPAILNKINRKKVNNGKKNEEYYAEKYNPLKGKHTKNEPMYNMLENNVIYIYIESGDFFSYQDKIKFNEEATAFTKPEELFHGHPIILQGYYKLKDRRLKLKNIKKISLKKKKYQGYTMVFINNIRGSGEQGLGYGNTEKEDYIFNKNIVILNEKYRLGNIKRAPIRLKLPVMMKYNDRALIKNYFSKGFLVDDGSREEKWFDLSTQNELLLVNQITPLVTSSIKGLGGKKKIENHYNKTIEDLIIGIFSTTDRDRQVAAIKKQYGFFLDNFLLHFTVFSKLYFVGMPHYSGDLIRYHELGLGDDEMSFDSYFRLKQIEFLRHDPAAAKIIDKFYGMGLDRYKPGAYVLFHIHQHKRYLYYIYSIIPGISFFGILKVIFYNPGVYIADQYILGGPIFAGGLALFLKQYVKGAGELIAGKELYLYKYHSTKIISEEELLFLEEEATKKENEYIDLYFDDEEKRKKVFGLNPPAIRIKRSAEGGRYPTHLNKNNKFYTHKRLKDFLIYIYIYGIIEGGRTNRFKYRNTKGFWDYYEVPQDILDRTIYPESLTNYKHRHGIYDSYDRLEGGGNIYSRGYENLYRLNQNKKFLELDYGFDFQKIKNFDVPLNYEKFIVHLSGGFSDALGVDFCRTLSIFIPDAVKQNRSRRLNGYDKYQKNFQKKRIKYKDYTEQLIYDFRYEAEISKYTEGSSEYNINIIQGMIGKFKRIIKNNLIEGFLGIERRKDYHPLQVGFEFQKKILKTYDYDLTNNLLTSFLIEAKISTQKLIITDYLRYLGHNKTGYLKIYDIFNNYPVDSVVEIIKLKNNSFNHGDELNMKVLLTISENEKHLYIFYHHLLNYKIKRLNLLLESDNGQLLTIKNKESDNKIQQIVEHNNKIELVITDKLETIQYASQCEEYLLKILKKITYNDKIDYKYNLLINTGKENNGSGSIIREIFNNNGKFLEIMDILLKIIINIFN